MIINRLLKTYIVFIGVIFIQASSSNVYAQQATGTITKSNNTYILTITKSGKQEKHQVTRPAMPVIPGQSQSVPDNSGFWMEKHTDGSATLFSFGTNNSVSASELTAYIANSMDMAANAVNQQMAKVPKQNTVDSQKMAQALIQTLQESAEKAKQIRLNSKDEADLKETLSKYSVIDPFFNELTAQKSEINWGYSRLNQALIIPYPRVYIKTTENNEAFYHGYDKTGSYVTSYKTGKAYKWNGQSLTKVEKVPDNLLNTRNELFTNGKLLEENGKPVITFTRNGKKEVHEVSRFPLAEMFTPRPMNDPAIQQLYEGSLLGIWIEVIKKNEDEFDGRIFNISADGTIIMTKILPLQMLIAM